MEILNENIISVERAEIFSENLERTVLIDIYLPAADPVSTDFELLLINDGQDLPSMRFDGMLENLYTSQQLRPLICVGIHCNENRIDEYGVSGLPDCKGRGAKAKAYQDFLIGELLPYIKNRFKEYYLSAISFAGFSMGGLSAIDTVWNHPEIFHRVGVFSGSLWWRSKDYTHKDYNQYTDRIMHYQIRTGKHRPGMKFFFQCGILDESEDRNHNGVIDSIDDTLDLMRELMNKGYLEGPDMTYLQLPDGKHDVASWGKAFPVFLKWGWGKNKQ